jgi:hypothetical protein
MRVGKGAALAFQSAYRLARLCPPLSGLCIVTNQLFRLSSIATKIVLTSFLMGVLTWDACI